jgi:HAD superfamily hydrolase (TIGR01549 family)
MIEAITFDFWNTLYRPGNARPLRLQRLLEVLNKNGLVVDSDRFEAADRVARAEWERAWLEDYRTIGSTEWLKIFFEDLHVQIPAPDFETLAHYFDRSLLDPTVSPTLVTGVAAMLERLAARYRLGVISDSGLSTGRTLRDIMQRDGILHYFQCLTYSDEIGVSKPHARAFTTTLDCFNLPAAHTLHIGDLTRTDIAGAKSIGLRAVRFAEIYDDPDRSFVPDAVVHSFPEFERWLIDQL